MFGSSLKKPGAESDQRTAHLPGHVRQPHALSSMPGVPGTAAPASCERGASRGTAAPTSCERVRAAGHHYPGVALSPDDFRSLGSSFCVPPTSDPARPTASGPWGGVREEIRVPPLFWVSVLVWCSCGCSLIVRDNAESRPAPYSLPGFPQAWQACSQSRTWMWMWMPPRGLLPMSLVSSGLVCSTSHRSEWPSLKNTYTE